MSSLRSIGSSRTAEAVHKSGEGSRTDAAESGNGFAAALSSATGAPAAAAAKTKTAADGGSGGGDGSDHSASPAAGTAAGPPKNLSGAVGLARAVQNGAKGRSEASAVTEDAPAAAAADGDLVVRSSDDGQGQGALDRAAAPANAKKDARANAPAAPSPPLAPTPDLRAAAALAGNAVSVPASPTGGGVKAAASALGSDGGVSPTHALRALAGAPSTAAALAAANLAAEDDAAAPELSAPAGALPQGAAAVLLAAASPAVSGTAALTPSSDAPDDGGAGTSPPDAGVGAGAVSASVQSQPTLAAPNGQISPAVLTAGLAPGSTPMSSPTTSRAPSWSQSDGGPAAAPTAGGGQTGAAGAALGAILGADTSTPAATGGTATVSLSASGSLPQDLSRQVLGMVTSDGREAVLHLHPPELGALTVRIVVEGRDVSAWFDSPQPQVQQAVSQALDQLRSDLGGAGYNLSGAWVGADSSGPRQRSAGSPPTAGRSPIAATTPELPVGTEPTTATSRVSVYV